MLRIALKMLAGDGGKYVGLLFGVAFTSFLITFAASFFCGFMTRGFALISENPQVDIWVMDPAVESVEQTTNMPDAALTAVRNVSGVASAVPLLVAATEARYANGRFQAFQLIGVDDATLAGAPARTDSAIATLRSPDAALVASGGTEGKLETPRDPADQWRRGARLQDAPTRPLAAGDEMLVNDHRVVVVGQADALARFPPRPMLYMTISNALRVLPRERHWLTFVLVTAPPASEPQRLARRIEAQTGLRARTASEFKADTVRWNLVNSEDVGDVGAMLTLAVTVGFGVTAVMLYMFTTENLWQYAVLKATGATSRLILSMIFWQAGTCALLGTGFGIGACGIIGPLVAAHGFPFRMMWFTPVLGAIAVLLVSAAAALISVRPAIRLEPTAVLAGR